MNESPLPGQVLRKADLDAYPSNNDSPPTRDLDEANIITSEVEGSDTHKIVLDIDFPAQLIPSSTEGHYHLIIDKELTWEQYERLLFTMADMDLLEEGYVSASHARGYTSVRLPWIKKGDDGGDTVAVRGYPPVAPRGGRCVNYHLSPHVGGGYLVTCFCGHHAVFRVEAGVLIEGVRARARLLWEEHRERAA